MTFTAVADTHTVIWYIFSDSRLSSSAREAIDRAAADGFFVGVSTISLAEIVYLSEKKRISPDTISAKRSALGATIRERAGSRVAVRLHDQIAVFHRPHPHPDIDKGAVRDVRRFLENAGIRP